MSENGRVKRGKRVRYVTQAKKDKLNKDSLKVYNQYIRSRVSKNKDVASTTYKTYQSYFNIFLCFLLEYYDNQYILDEEWLEDEILDVMEHYIIFLQDELNNNKKTINTKLSAVSSFYHWAVKRRKIRAHPFDGRLERMENANEEKIISEHFLTIDEVDEVKDVLAESNNPITKYDKIDEIIWNIAYDSACRIGALTTLTVSSLNLEKKKFENIREKRGKIVDIPFTQYTADVLKEYLEQRELLGIDTDMLIYVKSGNEWQGMSTQSIYARIKKIGHILGIDDFRPHSIRKTRINHVYQKDVNLAQTLANHESLETTSRFYSEKEDQSDVLNKIEALEL